MPDAQGTIALAKADTVGLWVPSDLNTDVSQYGLDLTTSPVGGTFSLTGGFRDADTRAQLTGEGGRELYVRVDLRANVDTDQVLIACGAWDDPGTATYGIAVSSGGAIECVIDGATSKAHTLAVLTTTLQEVSICWSTRPNPDTTGASNALISELMIYGHTDAAFEEVDQWTHAIGTIYDPSVTLSIGGYGNAFGWVADSRQVHAARVGVAFHPSAEFAEDWVAARVSHSTAYIELLEPVPLTFASGIGIENEWAGMANAGFIAAQADQTRARCVTDLVNEHDSDVRTLTTTASPTQWLAGPPGGSTTYKLDITRLRWLPHPGPTRAWVRVQVQSWVTAGAAVPIGVRVYAFNRPHFGVGPTIEGLPTPALDFDFVQATLTVDHGSGGVGEWLDLGLLRLPKFSGAAPGWSGTMLLGLAHAFDPAGVSANDANARLRIKSWSVRPVIGVD